MGFVFSFLFNPCFGLSLGCCVLVVFDCDRLFQEVVQHCLSSTAASVSCFCPLLRCLCWSSDVALPSSSLSACCHRVLLSPPLLPASASAALPAAQLRIRTSRHHLDAAAQLPGALGFARPVRSPFPCSSHLLLLCPCSQG